MGDFTLNTSLAALSLIYASYFLPQIADLRAALAGLIPLIARTIDAFADPLMGRHLGSHALEDRTAAALLPAGRDPVRCFVRAAVDRVAARGSGRALRVLHAGSTWSMRSR